MSRCGGFLMAASLVVVALLAAPAGGTGAASSSYSWETREALGDTAVALEISGPSGTNCSVTVELAGWMEDHGVVERIYLWEWADGESDWFHGSHGDMVHAFVAPVVDTRGPSSNIQEVYASTTTIPLPVRGGVTLTIAAPGLEPWPDGMDDGEVSLGIDLNCTQVVSVSLSGGREVQILTTRNAESGAGVWSPVANAGAGNLAMGSYTSDDVRLRAGTDGLQIGILSVLGGGMIDAWPLLPGSIETLAADGGPGDYILALNRAGGLEDGFWSVLMGLQPVDDLDEIATLPGL